MQAPTRTRALVALALLASVGLAGCGTRDTTPRASGIPSTTTAPTTLPPLPTTSSTSSTTTAP
jgi:hypothetical protein